jgi:hypothetical protein
MKPPKHFKKAASQTPNFTRSRLVPFSRQHPFPAPSLLSSYLEEFGVARLDLLAFEKLVTMDWQVHVYGAARAELAAWCAAKNLQLHTFAWRAEREKAGLARDALICSDQTATWRLPMAPAHQVHSNATSEITI